MTAASKDSVITTVPEDKWMTAQQAATALGTTRHMILVRAAAGEFETERSAGRLVVSRASVERAIAAATSA